MSEIQGGIDHQLTATVPMSAAVDRSRTSGRAATASPSRSGQLFGPILTGVPASLLPAQDQQRANDQQTNCDASQISVRIFADDGDEHPASRDRVPERGRGRAEQDRGAHERVANRRESAPARAPARTDRSASSSARRTSTISTCSSTTRPTWSSRTRRATSIRARTRAGTSRRSSSRRPRTTVTVDTTCPTASVRAVHGSLLPVGSQLVAVQDGFGFQRNAPDARRFWFLAQVGVDPGDPINYAPYYMMRVLPIPTATRRRRARSSARTRSAMRS